MYLLWSALTAGVVVGVELAWWRTGLFRQRSFWVTMAVAWGFQVGVDGWLTKLSAPIVIYDRRDLTGLRFPWDIPIEDFVFSFALITLVLMIWVALGRRSGDAGAGG